MAEIIIMPKQGLQMSEGVITQWLASEGEEVKKGQPLFEMETDKLTITIDSTVSGTLLKILHTAGETVPITQPIAIIGEAGEDIQGLLSEQSGAAAAPASLQKEESLRASSAPTAPSSSSGVRKDERVFATPRAKTTAHTRGVDYQKASGSGPDGLIIERDVLQLEPVCAQAPATPLARKIAALGDVDIAGVSGSGVRGKVVASDVRSAMAQQPDTIESERSIPLSGMRKVISTRMKSSLHEMAQAVHHMDVDMTEAVRIREQLKSNSIKVSYNDIVILCAARALMEHEMMNASMVKEGLLLKNYVNMGMAVAVEGGLIVPVIKGAHRMGLQQIAAEAADLASRAKDNKLSPEEYQGGTFTVSNLGMFGVDSFTAIINPPEAGILAVGKLSKRPVVVDDEIAIRMMLTLSLTYDHRIIDGAPAAQFLQRVKQLLENPALLL
ncbi:MAG: dihydrolipoamide acetyltransferase family protein [Christensenellales bacterium]|jgi:pyruvate dehydrogenase E2 component (dihydrolipoamide acetyltransferase)